MSKSFPIILFKNSFFTKKKCLGWDLIVIGSLLFAIVISCEWQVVPPLCQETRHQKRDVTARERGEAILIQNYEVGYMNVHSEIIF